MAIRITSQQVYLSVPNNLGSCSRLTNDTDVLGDRNSFRNDSLLASLTINVIGSHSKFVKIIRSKVLCEAPGILKGTISSVSLLVEFQEEGSATTELGQVSVDCSRDPFNPTQEYSFYPQTNPASTAINTAIVRDGPRLRLSGIQATFSTEPELQCAQCGLRGGMFNNPVTHCTG